MNSTADHPFRPRRGLHNPHVQTVLSSVGRKFIQTRAIHTLLEQTQTRDLDVNGVCLRVDVHPQPAALRPNAPLICLIPGWLGSANSAYVLSAASVLWQAGFSVARINLRDHGHTAHLNEGLFNSAMIDEVVDLIQTLIDQFAPPSNATAAAGVIGFSLGGNFALRIAKHMPHVRVLAVAPAIAPEETMHQIDSNPVYQYYFVRKWRKVWREKQDAFPGRYDFGPAFELSTVSALTDYFVGYYTDYATTRDYFQAYDLRGDALQGVQAHVLAAHDDPIIESSQFERLAPDIDLVMTEQGGHGAYLQDWRLGSWVDGYAARFFARHLHQGVSRAPAPDVSPMAPAPAG